MDVLASRIYNEDNEKIVSYIHLQLFKRKIIKEFSILPQGFIQSKDENQSTFNGIVLINDYLGLESNIAGHLSKYTEQDLIQRKRQNDNEQSLNFERDDLFTSILLLLCPKHLTAWNIRRNLFANNKTNLSYELDLLTWVVKQKPNSHETFSYHRWLVLNSGFHPKNLDIYLTFCDIASRLHKQNYLAWDHRLWLISIYRCLDVGKLESDLEYTKRFIESNVKDYCAFHYRIKILRILTNHYAYRKKYLYDIEFIMKEFSDLECIYECHPVYSSFLQYRLALVKIHIYYFRKEDEKFDKSLLLKHEKVFQSKLSIYEDPMNQVAQYRFKMMKFLHDSKSE